MSKNSVLPVQNSAPLWLNFQKRRKAFVTVIDLILFDRVYKIETTAGRSISVHIEIHDVAVFLHIIIPFEFDIDVPCLRD